MLEHHITQKAVAKCTDTSLCVLVLGNIPGVRDVENPDRDRRNDEKTGESGIVLDNKATVIFFKAVRGRFSKRIKLAPMLNGTKR